MSRIWLTQLHLIRYFKIFRKTDVRDGLLRKTDVGIMAKTDGLVLGIGLTSKYSYYEYVAVIALKSCL